MNYSASDLAILVAALVALILLNATFVAAEFSLVKLRYTRFGTGKMNEAKQSKGVAPLLDDMSGSIKLLRLGIAICAIAIGFLMVPLALMVNKQLGWSQDNEFILALAVGLVVAVAAHYIVGELVPRAMALQYPVQSIRVAAPLIKVFRFISKPLAVPLDWASRMLLKILRLHPTADLDLLDVESQIRSILSEGDELPELAENIVSNVLELRKRVAHDIMIPRNQLRYFDLNQTIEENLKIARRTGHTRFPLCREDLDHCIGIVHIKDVFRSNKPAADIKLMEIRRPMLSFGVNDPLERVLQRFLAQKKHFALLKDEFGGAVGAITLEDVLEELVGEIQDEFDNDMEMVTKIDEDLYVVDGLTPLHDLAEAIQIELESDEVSTFGGYITFELGRMPEPSEVFRIGDLEITATNLDERRVIAATVKIVPEGQDEIKEPLVEEDD